MAMCSYGANNPVLVYYHDPQQASQQLVPTPSAQPQAAAQPAARHQPQGQLLEAAGGPAGVGGAAAAAAILARGRARQKLAGGEGLPSSVAEGGARFGSAVRRERRMSRRSGEEGAQASVLGGLSSGAQRPTPLAVDPALAGDADGMSSARRKAAAAARRALTGATTPLT